MDDKRLQSEFDGYFDGARLPENLTADAKAQVKPRKRESLKWILRLAPVAAAFIFIVAISISYLSRFAFVGGNTADGSNDNSDTYSTASLKSERINPYDADIYGLEFVKLLALQSNASVEVTTFYDDEKIVLAQADITLLHGGYRHDTVIYAEYTDENVRYDKLQDYLTGDSKYYRGYDYILSTDYDEGENVYKVYIYTENVKYYFSVTTSEYDGYTIYFDFLKNL